MNLTPKAQTIERDFQNARAKANYSTFPEFARRYVKHNKDGVGKHCNWFSLFYYLSRHHDKQHSAFQEQEYNMTLATKLNQQPGRQRRTLWTSWLSL